MLLLLKASKKTAKMLVEATTKMPLAFFLAFFELVKNSVHGAYCFNR